MDYKLRQYYITFKLVIFSGVLHNYFIFNRLTKVVAQLNWTYYSLTGRPYALDMYHGDDSGHLIFFVNNNIIMIEFSQKEPKSFNFFIENQLIEFNIKKDDNVYDYEITPQLPKEIEDGEKIFPKHFWIPLILLIIALNLLVIFII